jgi:MFS family permease
MRTGGQRIARSYRINHRLNNPETRRPWLALTVTLAVQTLAALSQSAPAVLAPVLAAELNVGAQQIGNFTGVLYIFAMLSGLLLTSYIGRYGALRFSQIAMLMSAVGLLACTAGHLFAVALGAMAIGVGYGLANPTAAAILGRNVAPANRGLLFSIKQTGVPLGIAISGLIVPLILAAYGWRAALICCAIFCVICALSMQPASAIFDDKVHRTSSPSANKLLSPLYRVWHNHQQRQLALASLAYASTQVCFLVFLVTYLTLEHGLDLAVAASVLAAAQVASVGARPFWGWMADRWGSPGTLLGLLGIAMFAACIVLATLQKDSAALVYFAAATLCSVTAVAWNGVFYAELVRIAPQSELAAVTGGTQFFTFGGAMAGPVLFSLCVSVTGSYRLAFLLLPLLALCAGIMLLWSPHRKAHVS